MSEIRSYKQFVKCPGICQVAWSSDNPRDKVKEPEDLFDIQSEGIPSNFGKKNPQTSIQCKIRCLVCNCDLHSLRNLDAHVDGLSHKRKALPVQSNYQKRLKASNGITNSEQKKRKRNDSIEGKEISIDMSIVDDSELIENNNRKILKQDISKTEESSSSTTTIINQVTLTGTVYYDDKKEFPPLQTQNQISFGDIKDVKVKSEMIMNPSAYPHCDVPSEYEQKFNSEVTKVISELILPFYQSSVRRKIASLQDYRRIYKTISRQLRTNEKNVFIQKGGKIENLSLTDEMKDRFSKYVREYFEAMDNIEDIVD